MTYISEGPKFKVFAFRDNENRHASVKIACNQASICLVVSQKSLGSPAVSTTYVPGAEAIKVSVLSQAIRSV